MFYDSLQTTYTPEYTVIFFLKKKVLTLHMST